MSQQDKNNTAKAPIRLLLDSLPAGVYQEKWKAIKLEMHDANEYEHFRQSISRASFDLRRTHGRAIEILMQQLGLNMSFFTAAPGPETDAMRLTEIQRVVGQYSIINQQPA